MPTHLISLYDIHHYLQMGSDTAMDDNTPNADATLPRRSGLRFLDSGTYETTLLPIAPGDPEGPEGHLPWSRDLYLETAGMHGCPGDVLVSYDDPTKTLTEQIVEGWSAFAHVTTPGIRRSLLVHPNGAAPATLADIVARHAADLDILGITEKDISPPWFLAAAYLRDLRAALDVALGRYVPLHIFGCFDPQTIPFYFFSGADVFDGLAWMRCYFRDGHAYYVKEYEYAATEAELLDPEVATRSLLEHNVEEMERLRADLRYAVLTGDCAQFEPHLRRLYDLVPPAS